MNEHGHEHTLGSSKELLKKYGFKITKQRLAVISAFTDGCHPLSPEEVYKKNNQKKVFDLATVYRTLAVFEKAGIVKRVDIRNGSAQYELVQSNHHHHHIVCTECGLVEGFELCNIAPVVKSVAKVSKKFSKISDHSLELFGLCNNCSKI
jgi:Fe2+ or Zn2+ uptake regulation protein